MVDGGVNVWGLASPTACKHARLGVGRGGEGDGGGGGADSEVQLVVCPEFESATEVATYPWGALVQRVSVEGHKICFCSVDGDCLCPKGC